ncbi:MAG: hypothetical protein Q7T03_09415 [Deltaproteobacteria bacterium]|nr:hypothetical protein [Deltaproteobacteria bacterium]
MAMTFDAGPEFTKEFKRLAKKYRSLSDDLEEFKRLLLIQPLGNSKHFNVIIKHEDVSILKARLFCRYLKGSSLRIVYAWYQKKGNVEFIEIYFKGDKVNEDRRRIDDYVKGL